MKLIKVKKADSTVFQRIDGEASKASTAATNCKYSVQWISREASRISNGAEADELVDKLQEIIKIANETVNAAKKTIAELNM